jgi:hypothetical protein
MAHYEKARQVLDDWQKSVAGNYQPLTYDLSTLATFLANCNSSGVPNVQKIPFNNP